MWATWNAGVVLDDVVAGAWLIVLVVLRQQFSEIVASSCEADAPRAWKGKVGTSAIHPKAAVRLI